MKKKIIYIVILVTLAVGFFFVGWHVHYVILTSAGRISNGPFFTKLTPYLHLVYGEGKCSNVNTSDDYVCIYNLSHSMLTEADILANKLMQTSPAMNSDQAVGFYDVLHTNIQTAQKVRDAYFDAICDLDEMLIYGGSGMGSEREACRYYYAKQYLDLLKSLERTVTL
jgi:hypothetical protein